nr:Splicing factor 3B subunit 3 [Polyrhizophydium stewartii]
MRPQLLVCPIFASLPTSQQTRVFDPTPPHTRKVVLSTNIAETSITISGIRYVIDTGMAKVRAFNAKTGIESLSIQPISKASAGQRAGRAGRESAGVCFRLYTEQAFKGLRDETEPEIMRCNLAMVLLLLKASGIDDIANFDFMDKPSRASLVGALETLYALGALANDGSLTELGRKMAMFPLEPTFARVLIQSKQFKCTKEVITIVAMLSVDPVFFSPHDKREEAMAAKKKFMNYDGDHITLLNTARGYATAKGDATWCNENFINSRSMRQIMEPKQDIRKQLCQFCDQQDIPSDVSCGTDYEAVLRCFLSGFFRNVAIRQHDGSFRTLVSRQTVHIHPSSVLFGSKASAVMFSEWVHTTRQYLRNVSIIQPTWLGEVAPHYFALNSLNTAMHLYNVTLQPGQAINASAIGNFSGRKQQELVVARNTVLELLRPDPKTGKVVSVLTHQVFGLVRSLAAFRLTGSSKDYVVVGSDSGRVVILEYNPAKNVFDKVHQETFGKSGARRIVPGQYIAADPKGRAFMIGAMDKQKLVYILNRDSSMRLTISSPLEAHKSSTICHTIIGVDVGYENPIFASIEVDYSDADQDPSGRAAREAEKMLTYYELDLGLNHVVRKWSEPIHRSSNHLIAVPGGTDGPSGVLVCSEGFITWKHMGQPSLRVPIPHRPDPLTTPLAGASPGKSAEASVPGTNGRVIIVSSVVHRLKRDFFILVQTEMGDVFKIKLDYTPPTDGVISTVQNIRIKYYETLPVMSGMWLLKSGFLFAVSEFGNHTLYQIENLGDDDTTQVEYQSADFPQDDESLDFSTLSNVMFTAREMTNLSPVDEVESLCPMIESKVLNLTEDETPQIYAICGRGARSTFRILRHGLEVSEIASEELPGKPNAVWTVRRTAADEFDTYIVISFAKDTLVLSIGESVMEVTDSGFNVNASTLCVAQLGDDSLVQVYPNGIRYIRADRRVSEWRAPAPHSIVRAACSKRQVAISLSNQDIVYFELDFGGHLNEFQERVGMSAPVTSLAFSPIHEGRQRARYLAVGCSDSTVRMLSVEANTCLQPLSMQALSAIPESLALLEMSDSTTGLVALFLNIGLQNGVLMRTSVDAVTGILSDTRMRFLGTRPMLTTNMRRRYEALEFASSFTSELHPEGIVAIAGNTLRILNPERLGNVFNQISIPLKYTPRRFIFDEVSRNFIIVESDNGTYCPSDRTKILDSKSADAEEEGNVPEELPVEIFGLPKAPQGKWASCIRVLNPIHGETSFIEELDDNEAAFWWVVRIYDLGKKKLLRKCEGRGFPTNVVSLQAIGNRIIAADAQESVHFAMYRDFDNRIVIFADDTMPRWMTSMLMVDYDTVVGGDKFGNIFVNRLPQKVSEEVDSDETGSRAMFERGVLQGASHKFSHEADFFVAESVMSLTKTALIPGGRDVILYTTLLGGVGLLIPFQTKEDVDFYQSLEMAMRNEYRPLCGREHLAFRSFYTPVRATVDGDLCEQFNQMPNDKKRTVAEQLDRSVAEIGKKLEDMRNRVAF